MSGLRRKLAFSYGILIVIILAVGAWGAYHFARLGRAVDVILTNNYKSVLAAENMKEALERLDSAALFVIAGHVNKAREQFADSSKKFSNEFQIAANNITEAGEPAIIADIEAKYSVYRQDLERLLGSTGRISSVVQSKIYFEQLEPSFLALKNSLDDLLYINQQAMVAAHDAATRESRRAQISTAIVAVLGLVLALVFAWRFTAYIVDPISILTESAKRIGEGNFDQHIEMHSRDEIGVLAAEFNRMAVRLRDLRKSDYWRTLIEQKKSDAVIDSIDAPVLVTDAGGGVIRINRAAQQLFGVSRDDAGSDGDMSLTGSLPVETILGAVQDAVKMQRPVTPMDEAAIVPIKVGDSERGFRVRTTPMRDPDGRLIGAVALLEDTTEVRDVDRLKDEFISVASRKLRGPLHSLRMALHTLVERYVGDLTEKQAELLVSAQQDAGQLDELIDDMLELAEIESGRYQFSFERVRPADLTRFAIERHRSSAETRHVELVNHVWSDTPYVMADKQAVRRVFDNLLSNAIRHTPRDGKVRIESWERHNFVFISVHDTGEGIPAEDLPGIFGRFVHVEGAPGGGTGLGLALVKRLVEAQGGQVSAESRLGEGSTFTFALPKAGPA